MQEQSTVKLYRSNAASSRKTAWKEWKRGLPLYVMILPGLLFFLIFRYLPMGGIVIAFQDYSPFAGFAGSEWVGFAHFQRLFGEPDFWSLLGNTLILSALNLFLFFPAPVLIAVVLNEVRLQWFKKLVQTAIYMPHFLSWVVVVGITVILFATQEGAINKALADMGLPRIELMTDPAYFRWVYVVQNIWKEAGWNAIIFLAALAAVDPTLYEAAVVDGANRWKQVWHITLPALKSTILILFILRLGHVMDIGFEHIYLMQNSLNLSVSDVFDTYVYRTGVLQGEFSYTTAVGLFKSAIGLVLIVIANRWSKKAGEEGVY
ncbi:putative aldouronate transport system permease protein [Paenibacillus sp. UNCCL117]|uniref:ABC transporter permease n=1 Tax=unclassified Paenibacillus TaxID=185978 RepID=UPI000892677F|nr:MULTISPECIES: ABC transporter permease subunit [unclassified Paenibacillus]SDE20525.1 putative aldouronate transport system permease protein [Paenibacillus sp. cl123]SFW61701.1 putative aldouronate transport system permease protein [Paenibacillus sp. UNCCL117]